MTESATQEHQLVEWKLFRTGLIEAWGQGYRRILDACRQAGTTLPRAMHDGAGLGLEWKWVPPDEATQQVTPPVEAVLRVLADGAELGNAELRARLGLSDRTHLREHYVNPALAAGLVEMTLPDKPNSRLQKYRLTAAGKAWLRGQG